MTDEKRGLIELGQIIGQCATKLTAHDIHITDLMRLVYERTGMTREEMNNALDVYMEALAKIGVFLDFPDSSKKALLEYYS